MTHAVVMSRRWRTPMIVDSRRTPRRLTLVEYQTCPRVALAPEERDVLQAELPGLTITPSRGASAGQYDLTPGSWVGVLHLGTLSLEILPKLPIEQVMFLISYAQQPRAWRDRPAYLTESSSLVDVLAELFSRQVTQALVQGIVRGYRVEDEALAGVRGRLRFGDQIRRRAGHFPPMEVTYDDFTEDVLENRLIKAAARRLSRLRSWSGYGLPSGGAPSTGRLSGLATALAAVTDVSFPSAQIPSVHYTRLNEHYRPAAELARLILRSTSLDLRQGRVPAASLLVDMNQVYEDFVVAGLRSTLGLSERVFVQGCTGKSLFLDESRTLPLRPDLSWWHGRTCLFVGDVKYKWTAGGEHADLYQLLAYVTAAHLPGGLLVYAGGDAEPVSYDVVHAGRQLHVAALDLRGSPSDILDQIDLLALRVRRLRGQANASADIGVIGRAR
jgi:5-methylcytosine-specific restriction enzyme subunit McrC